jgi:hypothetical protein
MTPEDKIKNSSFVDGMAAGTAFVIIVEFLIFVVWKLETCGAFI